jgi:cellulose synthase/poly-beta-1,6-N-acetylglucosamine synthase-like glycosyltransferase
MVLLNKSAFWFAFACIIYIYAGYPVFLFLVSRLFPRRDARSTHLPNLSILIAAYNEEAGIAKKINSTLALDYPREKIEILILSDGSTDNTDQIVQSIPDPRVRLIRVEGRKGKTRAQNEGVEHAGGEVLIFSDATTTYHPQALRYLASNYADPRVGAVSGRYQYFDGRGGSPTGLGTIAFWNYENLIKSLQSRIHTITGCCGCIYSVRRSAYTPLRPDVISDLVQPLHVIQKGFRVLFEDRALAYEETTHSTSAEFSMRVRVVTRGMRGVLSVPELLKPWKWGWVSFQIWSHKILRWLVPFFMIVLFTSNALLANLPFYHGALLLQIAFYLLTVSALVIPLQRLWKPLGVPLYFCTLNAAALLSVFEILRGKKYVVWETVRT